MTDTSDDLKARYLQALSEDWHWAHIWELLANHPWYNRQLQYWAKRVARNQGIPLHWWEDVAQEAVVLLGKHLARRRDLGIDPKRAEGSFAPWMQTIILRDCQQALRRVRSRYQSQAAAGDVEDKASPGERLDRRIDVAWAIDQLDEPDRTAVILRGQQLTLEQLAEAMELSYWKARDALERGLKRLRFLLREEFENDE